MDERINNGVKSAVLTAVDNIMNEVRPRVQEMVDNTFVSYRDCVLSERSKAELALAVHRSLVETGLRTSVGTIISDFQHFIDDSTSVNIAKLEEAICTATTAFNMRRSSIVESINAAHRASDIRPPAIPHVRLAQSPHTILDDAPAAAPPPPPTRLELLSDNATPMGASKAALLTPRQQPMHLGTMPSMGAHASPTAHFGCHPSTPRGLQIRGTPVTCVGLLLTTPTHLILPQALAYISTARVLDAMVGHTHPTTFLSLTFVTMLPALCPALTVRPDPPTPQTNTITVSMVSPTIAKCRCYFLLTLDFKMRTSRTRSCGYFDISA